MQSNATEVDKNLTFAQFPELGSRLKLPPGWKFESKTLTKDLTVDPRKATGVWLRRCVQLCAVSLSLGEEWTSQTHRARSHPAIRNQAPSGDVGPKSTQAIRVGRDRDMDDCCIDKACALERLCSCGT